MPDKLNPSQSGTDDELLAKVVSGAISLPALSAEDADRFAAEVRKLVENRAFSDWQHEAAEHEDAVFILVKYPRKPLEKTPKELQRIVDLPVSDSPIFGKMFFLSKDAANGSALDIPCEKNKILDWLEDNGLAECSVVIAHRNTMKLSFRQNVSDNDAKFYTIRSTPPELSIDSLHEALKQFHEFGLVTPTMCESGVWEPHRAAAYVPGANAEKEIQKRMRYQLGGYFHGFVRVETEDKVPKGRIDVRLLAPADKEYGLKYWSIIELKVARSFQNAAKSKTPKTVPLSKVTAEIVKGVQQANEFTSDRDVKDGFLEIFDMRRDKSVELLAEPNVNDALDACTTQVHVNVRKMFGSSNDARKAGYA